MLTLRNHMAEMGITGGCATPATQVRVGNDLCRVADVAGSIDRFGDRYLTRVYTPAELATCTHDGAASAERLAARFAAKECVVKVLRPTGGVSFHDIEICHDTAGAPVVVLHGEMERRAHELGVVDASLSISHDHGLASAVLVAVVAADPDRI